VTRAHIAAIAVLLALTADASPLLAQDSASGGALEISVGGVWMGRAKLAGGDANETTSTGNPFRLFTTSSMVSSIAGVEGRVGVRISRRLELQGSGSYVAPDLRVDVSGDVENAPAITAAERIQQYTFGGGVLLYLSTGGKLASFFEVDAAYLRLLHEDRTLVDTGRAYGAGLGFKYAFHTGSSGVKAAGVRLDARAVARSKATIFDKMRISPAAGVSLYVRF
jgi:hypothetical protein